MQKTNLKFKWALVRDWGGRKWIFLKCLYRIHVKRKKSFYLPDQRGELPIRVLKRTFEFWLKTVNPKFFRTLVDQIRTNGLNPEIDYDDQRIPILYNGRAYIAEITAADHQIHLYDTFSAYLWCICYSMVVLFDEVIQKPHLRGNYTGQIDRGNEQVNSALGIFEFGMTLRTRYRDWPLEIPNPEEYGCLHAYYIEKTSGLYLAALQFIFCHEVAHNLFNHIGYVPATAIQSLADELAADNFAIDQILLPEGSRFSRTYKHGAVAAMCSLLFLSPNLYRAGRYPDAHDRINNIIGRLGLEDRDNIWGMASLAFRMWGMYYHIDFHTPPVIETYMDLFVDILATLNELNRPNF